MYAVPLVHRCWASRWRHVMASLRWHVTGRTRRWRVVASRDPVKSVVVLMMLLLKMRVMLMLVLVVWIAAYSWTVMAKTDVTLARANRRHLALRRVWSMRLRMHHRRSSTMTRWSWHASWGQHVGWGHWAWPGLHHLFVLWSPVLEPDFNLKEKKQKMSLSFIPQKKIFEANRRIPFFKTPSVARFDDKRDKLDTISVTRFGDLLDFRQLFKALG